MLKRNRTLKVLNLSENKIDVNGLVSVAEALVSTKLIYRSPQTNGIEKKYNLTLETLDLSRNPCSGPSLDGVSSFNRFYETTTKGLSASSLNDKDTISKNCVYLEYLA